MTDGAGDAGTSAAPQLRSTSSDDPAEFVGGWSPRPWTPPPEGALGRARRLARFTPLIDAWACAGPERPALTMTERDVLTAVQLSVRRGASLVIRVPGGLHRVPLLAAAMIAAESLDVPHTELSRLSGDLPPPGPVALVTSQIVRRSELDRLDASSVPVAPALHPHRLRGDGLASSMRGGRPRLVTGAARLLFVAPTTGFPVVLGVAPRVVVIDAAAETECDWLPIARHWAVAHHSVVITIADLHQEIEPLPISSDGDPDPVRAAGGEHRWIVDWPWLRRMEDPAATLSSPPMERVEYRMPVEARGRARLLAVHDPSYAGLAEVRERLGRLRDPRGRPAPWPVCRAARLARLLAELPTRTEDYDRIAPRYGGRTLRRLLDDILDADVRNDFPTSWRTRVAAEWGAVRASLTAVYEALAVRNPLTEVIADLVEDAYRRQRRLDLVCGSRSARDALTGRLLSSGTLRIEDSPLVTIRSINAVEAAGSHQTTLLIGPPAARWRRRLTAADLGQLTVLGAPGDGTRLYHALRSAHSEPSRAEARDARCMTLAALTGAMADEDELDGCELQVGVTTEAIERSSTAPIKLPDPNDLITAALAEPPSDADADTEDLEAEPGDSPEYVDPDLPSRSRSVRATPVVVRSTALLEENAAPTVFLLAAAARVQRLRDDDIQLLPVADVAPGMTLIGISEPERRTLFDRIRPLLAEQRPQVASLLLQLWQVAVHDARALSGTIGELTARLGDLGAEITSSAVAQWGDPWRIGPVDPANVARIGRIAGNGLVVGEAARIAAVMRAVRVRHAAVGSALVKLAGWHASGDTEALDRAAEALGTEIADLAADLTAWRVVTVGAPVSSPVSVLRRPLSIDEATRLSEPATDTGTPGSPPDGMEGIETASVFRESLLDPDGEP